jgi:hypothetical protein
MLLATNQQNLDWKLSLYIKIKKDILLKGKLNQLKGMEGNGRNGGVK